MKVLDFSLGFIAGIILKDHLFRLGLKLLPNAKIPKQKKIEGIHEVKLVLDITNQDYFKELYPKTKCLNQFVVIYEKEIIDFLNQNLKNLEITIKTICDLSLHHHTYKHLLRCGNLKLYIKYNQFTNVYTPDDTILEKDFVFTEKKFYRTFKHVVCAKLSNGDYVTQEFKRYFNQPDLTYIKLTPRILFNTPFDLILLNEKGTITIKNEEVI
jgi:hypothetical protein